ncbi:MAG TPA: collagen-binding domain-containing protein [Alphaproteobacteria bacterium]|nr:collagen-binding domain-containing protein [Alphaproteobacteria bacterium]
MRLRRSLQAVAVFAAIAAAPSAFATPYDTLSSIAGTYNMFLLGNLGTASSPFGSDAVGSVAVAGNAYITNASVGSSNSGASLVVGGNLTQTGGSTAGNVFVGGDLTSQWTGYSPNLVVGGNATMSGGNDAGNVFIGGNANLSGGVTIGGNLSMTGANTTLNASSNGGSSPQNIYVKPTTTVYDPSYWNTPKTTGAPATPTTPIDVYGSSTDIINASKSLAALNATTISSSGGTLTITLTQNGVNVIDLSMLNGSTINGINIVTANGVTPTGLILNVAGDNLTFNGGTFNLGSLTNQSVLFNFSDATNLNLTSLAFEGSLLAPLATVNFTSGNIDGTLIANNYYGNGELHEVPLNMTLPAYTPTGGGTIVATPEPGSLALFAGGLMILAVARRRRMISVGRS